LIIDSHAFTGVVLINFKIRNLSFEIIALHLYLLMQRMLAAIFAKFFERQFFLDFFLIAVGMIIHFFTNLTLERYEIFLRHNINSRIKK
jgi:hypothetical protein